MRHALALALLLLAAPAGAATIVIDFDAEAIGEFDTITPWPGVTLRERNGGDLEIAERAGEGRVLWVGHEGGTLVMDFSIPVVSVTVEFGDAGDSLRETLEWQPPTLVGFSGGEVIGTDTTTPTMNGLIDERLIVATLGTPIESAVFSFVQFGRHTQKSAVVGRIILQTISVPEPTLGAILLAAAATGIVRSRFRSPRPTGSRCSSRC